MNDYMFDWGKVIGMKIEYCTIGTEAEAEHVCTVYAYDQHALIGYGEIKIDDSSHRAVASVKVDEAYEKRDVESNIRKLLLAECKYCHIQHIEYSDASNVSLSQLA